MSCIIMRSMRAGIMLASCSGSEMLQGFWLDCVGSAPGQCPPGRDGVRDWDFRNASARAYFAREWGARIAAIPVLDGVYADSGDMTGCNVALTDFLDFICDLVALAASASAN